VCVCVCVELGIVVNRLGLKSKSGNEYTDEQLKNMISEFDMDGVCVCVSQSLCLYECL